MTGAPLKQIHGWTGLDPADRGAAVALGNFDGVHLGHLGVLEAARMDGAPLAAAVFDPHPRRFFAPDSSPFRLSSDQMRAVLLSKAGVNRLFSLPFDADLRETSPENFAKHILSEGLGAVRVAVGEDFRFGKDRAGDIEALKTYGNRYGFDVAIAPPVTAAGGIASSTRVREALAEGDIALAGAILGHDWRVEGPVVAGDRLGRTLGWPTANIDLGGYIRPLYGVYAVFCRLEGEENWRPGVASLGVRPTVEGKDERFEAHLFDFEGDLYGRNLTVSFAKFLRPEAKFDNVEAMTAQIVQDAEAARALLKAQNPPDS